MKTKKSLFLWPILFIFLTTYYADSSKKINTKFFTVENIQIKGVIYTDFNKIKNNFDIFKGNNIIFINNEKIKRVISDFEFIKEIKLKKIYPNSIIINILEYEPLGILYKEETKFILTEKKILIKWRDLESLGDIPLVYGLNAENFFYDFYKNIKNIYPNMHEIKQLNYYKINRWDIILKNDKVIKLPSKNYEKSLQKFLQINEKEEFSKFKVFDFRVKDQLILK